MSKYDIDWNDLEDGTGAEHAIKSVVRYLNGRKDLCTLRDFESTLSLLCIKEVPEDEPTSEEKFIEEFSKGFDGLEGDDEWKN